MSYANSATEALAVDLADTAKRLADAVPWAPVRVVCIVIGAMVARWLLFRAINAFIKRAAAFSPHPRLAGTRSGRMLLDSAGLLAERRRQRVQTLGSTLRSLASFTVLVVAVLMVLKLFGVDTAPALASAGIVAAAVAFGAQALVRDFLTGAFLIVEDQYGVGDVIDLGTLAGTVEAVGLRVTQIRDESGVVWYVRNGEIVRVGNRSQGWGHAVVNVPVPYEAELSRVREVLGAVAAGLAEDPEWRDDLLAAPEVQGPESLAPDHLVMRIVAKTPPGEKITVERELRERVRDALAVAGWRVAAETPTPPPA